MSIKFGSNRFIPRPASGGDSLWQLYGANVVGLVDLANKVAIGANAMLLDEELRVAGGIAATPTGAGNDAFVQVGVGSALALSGANSFRLICFIIPHHDIHIFIFISIYLFIVA